MKKTREIFDPIQLLIKLDWTECEELEFKSARGGLPKHLWETYSAMANTQGGAILLGVEDDGSVSGVKDPGQMKSDFWNTLNNLGKVSLNLLTNEDVIEQSYQGKTVLAIRIPQATRQQRALVQKNRGRWAYYSLPKTEDSLHKEPHSLHSDGKSRAQLAASAQHKKRLLPSEMEALITQLCQETWLTRDELAALLRRNPEGLRQRFLGPMVAHGRLRLRYPDKPNRADQAYTAGSIPLVTQKLAEQAATFGAGANRKSPK